ncbi:MAG: hypothetical protein R6V67_01975 [Spirochaetia bacterium]
MRERVIYKNRVIFFIAAAVALPLLFAGCEDFFTTSPLSWAQRDPSKLSADQQISYAEFALGSGDTEKLKDAYNAIKDSDDPEVQYLASQVAIGASGINDAISGALEDPDNTDLETVLNEIDGEWLDKAEASLSAAEDGDAEISSEDYVTVAAAAAIRYAQEDDNNEFPNLDGTAKKDGTYEEKTVYYLEESVYTSDDMEELLSLAEG